MPAAYYCQLLQYYVFASLQAQLVPPLPRVPQCLPLPLLALRRTTDFNDDGLTPHLALIVELKEWSSLNLRGLFYNLA